MLPEREGSAAKPWNARPQVAMPRQSLKHALISENMDITENVFGPAAPLA